MIETKIKKPKTILLFLLISFPSFVAVLISPAMPKMSDVFRVSNGYTQQLITVYVIGYAFSQLLYSPFANRFGRKTTLYFGLILYVLSCLVSIFGIYIMSLETIFVGRFLSALGASGGLALTYTMINDYYPPNERRSVVGYITIAYAIMPSIAVLLGGFLTTYFSWKASFYFLFFYSFVMAFVIFFLPETLVEKDLEALKTKKLFKAYLTAFKRMQLIAFSSISGLASVFIYITISESPFIGVEIIGLKPSVYGLLMLLPYFGQIMGSLSAARLSQYISPYLFLRIAFIFILFGTLFMFFSFLFKWVSVVSLLIPIFIIMIGLPITYSNTSLMALLDVQDRATSSCVMTFLLMLPTVIILLMRAMFLTENPLAMPSLFLLMIFLMYLLYFYVSKRYKEPT